MWGKWPLTPSSCRLGLHRAISAYRLSSSGPICVFLVLSDTQSSTQAIFLHSLAHLCLPVKHYRGMRGMKHYRAGFCTVARFSGRISSLLLLFFVFVSAEFNLVHCQGDGFISIDCGASQTTVSGNLSWTIDDSYTSLGENAEISSAKFPYNTLRYFPDATVTKSCYVFNTTANISYLIRAGFLYGNYDNLSTTEGEPSFVLLFGANVWSNVEFNGDSQEVVTHEMIVLASSDTASVCLARSGTAGRNPFISSLEIRPFFSNKMYSPVHQGFLMQTNSRIDFGNNDSSVVRFPDDVYDRIWIPDSVAVEGISTYNTTLTTNNTVSVSLTDNLPPSKVMQTARSSNKIENMSFAFNASFGPGQYYLALYFAEIQNNTSERRIMDIYIDGSRSYHALNILNISGLYNALELFYDNYTISNGKYTLSLIPTDNSTVAPIINAAESYFLQRINSSTSDHDVQALEIIKTSFNLSKWMGDPCIPYVYKWSWLDCDSINSQTRVIALNLSGLGLRSEIPPALGDLSALTSVDLHNNSLYGEIPSSLASLSSLKFLDLSFNNLSGEYPTSLNKLDFNIAGNPFICITGSCSIAPISQSSTRPVGIIIGPAVASFFVFVAVVLIGAFYRCKFQKRQEVFLTHSAHWPPVPPFTEIAKSVDSQVVLDGALQDVSVFSLADMQKITDNFGDKIADGAKGILYHGTFLDGQEVVVKLLKCDIRQTPMEFLYNVAPLSYVNHRNLLTPIGFCAENNHFAVIYEGAYSGTLYDYLHGKSFLDWRTRLSILQQIAQGLEHLHSSGIAHGDLRSRNVLLTEEGFLAKVADFGMYKLSSDVNTTLGYLDSEDQAMKASMEKKDIYSFGVLILEVVSELKPSDQSPSKDAWTIIDRVRKMYEGGEDDLIADNSFGGNYNKSAMLKIVKLALEATATTVDDRPSMTQLVMELKEAHKIELGHHVAFTGLDASDTPNDLEIPILQSL